MAGRAGPTRASGLTDFWTELWSVRAGRSRTYCGVARTEDGFAVDVFRDDTCIASGEYATREMAVRAALARERDFRGSRTARHREQRKSSNG
jgi:hypothetical protein